MVCRIPVTQIVPAKKSSRLVRYRLATAGLLVFALTAVLTLGRSGQPQFHSTTLSVKAVGESTAQPAKLIIAQRSVPLAQNSRYDAPVAALPVISGELAPAAPSSERLLAKVSTMDLTMPIAEPDLDIDSRHSLWAQVGKTYGIDPLLLYSVALVESKALYPDGTIAPTPWLFRVDDHLVRGDRQHVQLQMAVASQFGSAVQDVGIMQVYYPMHRDAVRDPLALLDPRTNISVAAKILRDGMHETRDRVLGVGYYHSHTPDLARDYGTAVLAVYGRLKAAQRAAVQRAHLAHPDDAQLAALHQAAAARI